MGIKKAQFKVKNGGDWDKYHLETSADQVKFKKMNNTESDLQSEVENLQSKLGSLLKPTMILDSTKIMQDHICAIRKGVKSLLLLEMSNAEETGRAVEIFIPGIPVTDRKSVV